MNFVSCIEHYVLRDNNKSCFYFLTLFSLSQIKKEAKKILYFFGRIIGLIRDVKFSADY